MPGRKTVRSRLSAAAILLGGVVLGMGTASHIAPPVRGEVIVTAPKAADRVLPDDVAESSLHMRQPAGRTTIVVRRPVAPLETLK